MSAGSQRLISAEALSVDLGGRRVLDRVDLSVSRGEIVTIVGPNGSGKTTLMRAIIGLLPLSSGRLVRAPGLRIGYVPQRLSVDVSMPITVARFMDLPRRRGARAVAAALAEAGLGDHEAEQGGVQGGGAGGRSLGGQAAMAPAGYVGASHAPSSHASAPSSPEMPALAARQLGALSGGQLQRVLLAKALMDRPDLLILDEATAGLDQPATAAFYRRIEQVRAREGCAVLMVSHDLQVVMRASDRVVCLNRHVCCQGTPEAVSASPAYLGLFGTGEGALALYRHHHDHSHDGSGPGAEPCRESAA